ncbi:hypothetical protein AX15_007875 [Amanita polypyramis BW_CC]|nr:hypothetical protein AX15_007875 [Amanita polypyramis BW_CC]
MWLSRFVVTLAGKGPISRKKLRSLVVVFNPPSEGYYEDTLEITFAHPNKGRFVITRRIFGTAGSLEDQEALKPKGPYKKKWIRTEIGGLIIPGPRPAVWSPIIWVQILGRFEPPKELIKLAFPKSPTAALKAVKRLMPPIFNIDTYRNWFQTLLFIEGEQRRRDLDSCMLEGEELVQNKQDRYDLQVKGVADKLSTVLVGDYILARRTGEADNAPWYQGRVHDVDYNVLGFYFHKKFSTAQNIKADIRFVYNRLPERRKHQAITGTYKPMRLLFPDETHINYRRVKPHEVQAIVPINREMMSNEEQLEAVAAILKQPPGSVPFVIFGPPGTGKTLTIVEAMRQLLLKPDVRILACAPGNIAADIIADRLRVLGPSVLFRLNSLSRKPTRMNHTLKPYSLLNDNEVFAIPPLEELMKYRIIVSTCVTAGVLWGLGSKRGHFSHIFVDEAGHGEEPEVMIPFMTLADDNTNFILAGDHRQLGPDIRSSLTKRFGLQKSYLKRLMEREIYDENVGRRLTVVKLLKNFRSHEDIMHFSNIHFYNSELIPCGDPAVTHSLEDLDILPKKRFPIIFHGIAGRDQQEEANPSFFNIDEATIVKKFCVTLMADRKKGIRPEHIGVITPYSAQKYRIQHLFSNDKKGKKLEEIKVGCVDEFQGQERRIIILSTVRSTPNHVMLDMRRSLGFVASPMRLNVAMTRAQALLIVVGNPIVLSLDPLWRSFLNYVHVRGGWQGIPMTWNPEESVDLSSYDARYRKQAEAKLEDTLTRLKAIISQDLGQYDIDIPGEDIDD